MKNLTTGESNFSDIREELHWVKKLDPFSYEHNFGKYCPILIILSLLQAEINYDKMNVP